jgi:hypothetical protein
MFVESMTFEELRREFERDKESLVSKVRFHSAKLIKQMRKTNRSTLDQYYEYVSPRKNRFVYHFMITSPKREDFRINVYAYFFTKRSYAVLIYSITSNRLLYCTSHLFTRYYQLHELDNDIVHDLIKKFMNAEHISVTQPLKPMGNGVWQAFIQMNTGVALGYLHNLINLVELRTFITNDMLKGEQVELSKQLEEKFKIHVVRKSPDQ